jgi:cyclic pyranopterin phosphate synthase
MVTLTHLDRQGKARMVDVTEKDITVREATAQARVIMKPETSALIAGGKIPKGDALGVARIAGIMAAKKTGTLIPMCHPLELTSVEITFDSDVKNGTVKIKARVKTVGRTGVEMEALTAACVAALTIYDMCKSADRGMVLSDIRLLSKKGGRSGTYRQGSAI